jgi:steroid 5-alpha reductase family enzyme
MDAYIITLIALIIFISIWFLLVPLTKNVGLVDLAWGLLYVVTIWVQVILFEPTHIISYILTAAVSLWGLRLFIYLAIRNWNKKEDFRYTQMKKKWKKFHYLNIYLKVFIFQALLAYVVSLPIQVSFRMTYDLSTSTLIILMIGMLFFIIGFIFEVLADAQLKAFKADPNNKGKILSTGVWSLSRHPNHFGDFLVWWGFFFISFSSLEINFIWAIIGPLIMSYLLRYISGVPLLEKRYKDDSAYQAYAKVTPIFIPIKLKK